MALINLKELKPNIPKANIQDYVWTVYGRPKAGKTSLFYELIKKAFQGAMENGLLLGFEKGYQALKGILAQDIDDWASFIEVADQLIDEREELPFRILGFDTVDVAWQMCTEYVLQKRGIADKKKYTTIGDIPYGAGYELVEKEFTKQLNRLHKAGFTFFFITHDKDKKVESRDGQSYDQTTVNLPNRAKDVVLNMSDFIIFIDIVKEKDSTDKKKLVDNRYIYFRSDGDIVAGSRFPNINDKIPYDVGMFIDTFEQAVLSEVGDNVDLDKLKKEQAQAKEEKAKAFVEQEKAEMNKRKPEDIIKDIDSILKAKTTSTPTKAKAKAKFEEILGDSNYLKATDSEKLEQALKALKELTGE